MHAVKRSRERTVRACACGLLIGRDSHFFRGGQRLAVEVKIEFLRIRYVRHAPFVNERGVLAHPDFVLELIAARGIASRRNGISITSARKPVGYSRARGTEPVVV